MNIDQLVSQIRYHEEKYRLGHPEISDIEFDALKDQLHEIDPTNKVFSLVGFPVSDDRKEKLRYTMASMDKLKSFEEYKKWCELKGIDPEELLILTPKLDGLSFLLNEEYGNGWTRGDGIEGQRSDQHFGKMKAKPFGSKCFTIGELIMPNSVFESKFSDEYENPRNMVGGLINSKDIDKIEHYLKEIYFIRYGLIVDGKLIDKDRQLTLLNTKQQKPIEFLTIKAKDLTHEILLDCYTKWGVEFEIDGIIIEVNSAKRQQELGRETTSNNPAYARAYKANFEDVGDSVVNNIRYQISKTGKVKPVLNIEPVRLNGVTVSNATAYNAKYLRVNNIGIGTKIKIKRSGAVIPKVVQVIEPTGFVIPTEFGNLVWDETETELLVVNETDAQKIQQLIAFFAIMKCDEVGPGICKIFFDNGYTDAKQVAKMSKDDILKLPGFAESKTEKVYQSIQSVLANASLSTVQHATGLFTPLGSKKLLLLEHFTTKPSVDDVTAIKGFSEKTANVYVENYDTFFDYIKDFPITFGESKKEMVQNYDGPFNSYKFVFTGVRDANANQRIIELGGIVQDSINSQTTHLIMKEKGSGSSKEQKALKMGIVIWDINELNNKLNEL